MKSSRNGKAIGVFSKDGFPGEFCESWQKAMGAHSFENIDIGASIAYILAPKEESELVTMKKACLVSVDVFGKYLKEQILEIIDAEKVSLISIINFCLLVIYVSYFLIYRKLLDIFFCFFFLESKA